jgi:hypothetical protein
LLRVVRLHHAFSQILTSPDQSREEKRKKKRMNECSNNGDKIGCSRRRAEHGGKGLFDTHNNKRIVQIVYGGPFVLYSNKPQQVVALANYYVPTQDQQLPIKENGQHLQAAAFVEWYSGHSHELVYSFQDHVHVPA